jgi:hypothetical protein
MPLFISEFLGVASGARSPHPNVLLASQSVTVGAGSTASAALQERTTLVRLLADEDCNVAIGPEADAETDPVIHLIANVETFVHVAPGDLIATVTRA